MFIFNDNFYKTADGNYYTEEYMKHNGEFIESSNVWKRGNKEIQMFPAEEIRYNYDQKKVVRCNYSQLFRDDDSMVLCNNIADDIEDLELTNGSDYDEEDDVYEEIFQWFIINPALANSLQRHTDEIIYYHNRLDIYILAVTHCGTGWDYVDAEYIL